MRVDVVTVFPDYLAPLGLSLMGKARERGLLDVRVHDLRAWTTDVHRTVDDSPYGGGPGMVMTPEPWRQALDAVAPPDGDQPLLLLPSPSGRPFTQALAAELAAEPWLAFACGRYEGIDGRVAEHAARRMRVLEVSLGDYVLAGGEVAVLVVVEAVARLLPGVLGNAASAQDDSFARACWRGRRTPARRSGRASRCRPCCCPATTRAIARWRRDQALRRTAARRPELMAALADRLDERDRAVLAALPPPDDAGPARGVAE